MGRGRFRRSRGLNFWPRESVGEDFFTHALMASISGLMRASGKISSSTVSWPRPQLTLAQLTSNQLTSVQLTLPQLTSLQLSSSHITSAQLTSTQLSSAHPKIAHLS